MITAFDLRDIRPAAEGMSFGDAGAYEWVRGIAKGTLDPDHPGNNGIGLLDKTPRNGDGLIEYATGFVLLRPVDPAHGNGKLVYEVSNRGRLSMPLPVAGPLTRLEDPTDDDALKTFYPVHKGYVLMWSGWEANAVNDAAGLSMTIAEALEDGKPLVQTVRNEFCFGTRSQKSERVWLSHRAATQDQAPCRLTVRRKWADTPRELPPTAWAWAGPRAIELKPDFEPLEPGSLYEFYFPAIGAKALGVGFAALRDLISHLRRDEVARRTTGRPLTHTIAHGNSQSGRFLRHFVSHGFNKDESGTKVFDAVMSHIAGAGRLFIDEAFAQPTRTSTQHENKDFPESWFPFAAATTTDPFTGETRQLLRNDGSDPLIIETNTGSEYWQKGASLIHTDPTGARDLSLPANTRAYLICGTQHGGKQGTPSTKGPCVNRRNPHDPTPILRALFTALDEWVSHGTEPPPSVVPKIADGTLVDAVKIGFPPIPGAGIARTCNTIAPRGDWVHPQPSAQLYGAKVAKVDSDGNELGGVRTPDITVPLGTHAGWNVYQAPYPEGELADRDGSFIPFAATKADRETYGDPRPSLEERYPTVADYVAKVKAAAEELVSWRLLLPEEVAIYVARAQAGPRGL